MLMATACIRAHSPAYTAAISTLALQVMQGGTRVSTLANALPSAQNVANGFRGKTTCNSIDAHIAMAVIAVEAKAPNRNAVHLLLEYFSLLFPFFFWSWLNDCINLLEFGNIRLIPNAAIYDSGIGRE
jgi:hypothetical protein